MKNTDTEFVVVGKIGSPYGIKGWLKITSFTDPISNITEFEHWYLENGSQWEQATVKGSKAHGKGIIVKLKGPDTPEQARLFTGKRIAVKRSDFPALDKNEFYWSDLEGLTVIDQHGKTLGVVSYLIETGSNDVLVVKDEQNKEFAIPYLPDDVVKNIDLAKKEIHVKWEIL